MKVFLLTLAILDDLGAIIIIALFYTAELKVDYLYLALIPLAGLVWALRILALPQLRPRPWLYPWVGIAALACLYIAGEEASWGQHYFGWGTPESWQEVAGRVAEELRAAGGTALLAAARGQ